LIPSVMTSLRYFLALCVLLLVSCGPSPSVNPVSKKSEDAEQAEVRIAALSPAIAVMLRDLGYEDRIVAKHDYDMVLSNQVPVAGSELGFDLEVLIKANPTHLFFQKTSAERSPKFVQIAEERGWIIIERPLNTLDDIAVTMDDLYYQFKGAPQEQPTEFDVMHDQDRTPPSEGLAIAWDDSGPIADAAGKVLVLGSVDPIGAMGPGSYHYQIIERLGATPAIAEGSMWIELDYEDLIALNPDSIVLIAPQQTTDDDRFGEPAKPSLDEMKESFGPLADLPIAAFESGRIGVIDHPLGLLPSGALGEVADEIAAMFELWAE